MNHSKPTKWTDVGSAVALAVLAMASTPGAADADGVQSTEMWGSVQSSAGNGDSAMMHQSGGIIAGQVNAAEEGILYAGPAMTVVGSQSIVQVTGNNNVVSDINQNAVNNGNLELNSQVN